MKLLHIIHSANPAGGGPIEGLKQVAGVMAEMGHSTEVVTLDAPDAQWLREFPFPVYATGPGKGKYGYAPRLIPWLQEHTSNYDAVLIRGIWQYHSFAGWKALRNSNVPYFVFAHGMLDPWFKRAYPLKHAKKWLYWPWGDYRVLRDAEAVLFTSEEERVLARQSFWLYRCKEVVVNYGTSTPSGDAEFQKSVFFARYPELRNKRTALFLGRVHPKKGCDLLIKAFASVLARDPQWQLVIAGPDQVSWKAELIALAREQGVADSITWTGMISGDLKYGAIHAAEVLVLPSHQENFGIVVAEALACGKPALISNKVNIWREVQQDKAGIVGNDDFAGTCSLLSAWNAMTEDQRLQMGDRAQRCFKQRFEIRKSAESLIHILSDVVQHSGPQVCKAPKLLSVS
jgi:glycosyltransferase involved in cell wall biosynthesis